MKFKVLGQRDKRWKNTPLGFSKTTTIGSHGCLITCFAMLADLTPEEVNIRFKNVSGYANKNLVIWNKIDEAIPWLEFEWRHYVYNNEEVLQTIKDFGACVVEVDGSKIGGDRHWVLYTGNQKMHDPWFGTVKKTNYYKPLGYVPIKIKKEDNPLKECLRQHEELVVEAGEKDKLISGQAIKIKKLEKRKVSLETEIEVLDEKIVNLEKLKDKWLKFYKASKKNLASCQKDRGIFQGEITKLKKNALKTAETKEIALELLGRMLRIKKQRA